MADALLAPEENGHFISSSFKEDDVVASTVLEGFSVSLKNLWENSAL